MAAQFSFPSRQLYGVSIDVDAPFIPQLHDREGPPSSTQAADARTIRLSIMGTWELASYQAPSISNSEDIFYPLGREAKGTLIYSPDGYMSCTLLRPGQPNFSTSSGESPGRASNDELAESARRYLGYTGPFYLDESGDQPTVRHVMRLVNFPNWMGNVQSRVIDLHGDRLTLALESVVEMGGVLRNPLLIFRRAPRNDPTLPQPETPTQQAGGSG